MDTGHKAGGLCQTRVQLYHFALNISLMSIFMVASRAELFRRVATCHTWLLIFKVIELKIQFLSCTVRISGAQQSHKLLNWIV